MADVSRVRRNIESMVNQGASMEEVDAYVAHEGLTTEQVRGEGPGVLQQVGDFISDTDKSLTDFQTGIRRQVTGPEKGTRTDLPDFENSETQHLRSKAGPMGGISNLAGMFSDDDEGYAGIIQKQLGDRYIGTEKDPNGYEIITYRGDDGKEYVAYVNSPGLDLTDVNRELGAMIPLAITGFAASKGLKGVGLGPLGRVLGVGGTEAGATAAQDVTGANLGASFKPLKTLIKTVIAGGAGGLFEGLSGPVTRKLRKWFASPGFIDPKTGALTPVGTKTVEAAGIDPADVNARIARELQAKMPGAADPAEVGVDIRTGEFEIPSTRGQRTKRPDLLTEEEQLRQGNQGEEARKIMESFDKQQTSAIDRAVNDSVGMSLAPRQGGRETQTLGQRIQSGARTAKEAWNKEEGRLWDEVKGPMFPDPRYREQTIIDSIQRNLVDKDIVVDQITTPTAVTMMDQLDAFAQGKAVAAPHRLLERAGANKELGIDEMRRRLWAIMGNAEVGSPDRRAAGKIYDAYLDWIDDVVEQGKVNATPEELAKLKLARGFSRDVKGLFAPRTEGKKNEAARIIQKIMEDPRTSSAEDVVRAVVPSSPNTAAAKGSVQALRHMRGILRAAGEVGQDTWDDIRLAYWSRLVSDKRAQTLSPLKLKNNIEAALANQKSVLDVLYTPEEQAVMRRLAKAMDDVTYKPPNPSRTSFALDQIANKRKKRGSGMIEDQVRLGQRSATFQGKRLERMLWRMIGRHLPNTAGMRDFGASKLAKGATSPALTQKPGSPLIAPMGTIGALEFADDIYPEAQ